MGLKKRSSVNEIKKYQFNIKQVYRSKKKSELFLGRIHFMWLARKVTKGTTIALSLKTMARMVIKGAFEAYRFGNYHPKLSYNQELLLRFAWKQLKN